MILPLPSCPLHQPRDEAKTNTIGAICQAAVSLRHHNILISPMQREALGRPVRNRRLTRRYAMLTRRSLSCGVGMSVLYMSLGSAVAAPGNLRVKDSPGLSALASPL